MSPRKSTAQGFRAPFLIVNPKSYLYGRASLDLALHCDEVAASHDVDVIFTAQHADLRLIAERTSHLWVTAQHMDGIVPGRGMGRILPESLVDAGARAVVLNHAEHPLAFAELDAAITRAREVGLMSIVCADTDAQCRAIASMGPDVMICEPTANIGTGEVVSEEYVDRTLRIVREVDPRILVIEAAGVNDADDVARVLRQGADGSGGTSSIVKAQNPQQVVDQMVAAVAAAREA